jgi:hypothetical protein
MTQTLVRDETPADFFREQLVKAMEHQRISTSAFTECYLVNLLAACVNAEHLPAAEPGYDETPLALLYVRALHASRLERVRRLRELGDTTLFLTGFFEDSLERRLVDVDYYRALGGGAYFRLSVEEPFEHGPAVFDELARRFPQLCEVLAEVSERSRLASDRGVLRLYERWQRTHSRRAALLLAERGIAPLPESGTLQ